MKDSATNNLFDSSHVKDVDVVASLTVLGEVVARAIELVQHEGVEEAVEVDAASVD